MNKTLFLISIFILLTGCSSTNLFTSSSKFNIAQCENKNELSVNCGKAPSSAFDENGKLWVVYELNDHLYVSSSSDKGLTYSKPAKVNPTPELIYARGENRPKIVIGSKGEIYLSWTKNTQGRYTGDIRFTRSLDQGKTFEEIKTINDDGFLTSHRFDSLAVTKSGDVFISWIDKRDNVIAAKKNPNMKRVSTAAIYYAISSDSGKTFNANKKLIESSCVCCRIAMTPYQDDSVALSWRHVFEGNIRDHAYATINSKGEHSQTIRLSRDDWKIDACPHHGPSMIKDINDELHVVWFTASDIRKGIFYGQLDPNSQEPINLKHISALPSAGHPYIESHQDALFLVWKIFNGERTQIMLQKSNDLGVKWTEAKVISETDGESDHPFLLNHRGSIFLAWSTTNDGLKILKVGQ